MDEEQIKREYVLHFILKPTMPAEEAHTFRTEMNAKIQTYDAQILASLCEERARRLAYPIKKESQGYFCESIIFMSPAKLDALFDSLKLEPRILRYTIEKKRKMKKHRQRKGMPSFTKNGDHKTAALPDRQASLPARPASPELQRSEQEGREPSLMSESPSEPSTSPAPAPARPAGGPVKREKISMEEIDKKLDEIIKNI